MNFKVLFSILILIAGAHIGSNFDAEELAVQLENNNVIILEDESVPIGVDLVLSGHTHGGWLFPMNIISSYIGPDDRVYGTEQRGDTTYIVTSGISDWALPFKTGAVSEYVVIDIQ